MTPVTPGKCKEGAGLELCQVQSRLHLKAPIKEEVLQKQIRFKLKVRGLPFNQKFLKFKTGTNGLDIFWEVSGRTKNCCFSDNATKIPDKKFLKI